MTSDAESAPDRCPNGHDLGSGRVLVDWESCSCTPRLGRRKHYCREHGAIAYRSSRIGPNRNATDG